MDSIYEMRAKNRLPIKRLKENAVRDGIPLKEALAKRKLFLTDMLVRIDMYGEGETDDFPGMDMDDVMKELRDIGSAARYINHPPNPDEVTSEMISDAKKVSIRSLLEFTRGITRCIDPKHEDNNPSAYYGSRTNRLICPVCNASWDAIEVKMLRDNVTFLDAVRSLCDGSNY